MQHVGAADDRHQPGDRFAAGAQQTGPAVGGGQRARGAVRGAAAGAVVGEVANGDAGKGAGTGAAVGVVAGGSRARRDKRAANEAAQQNQQQTMGAVQQCVGHLHERTRLYGRLRRRFRTGAPVRARTRRYAPMNLSRHALGFALLLAMTSASADPSPGWGRAMPPAPDARVKITEAYAKLVGRDAYFWAWPLVNVYNRRLYFASVKELVVSGPLPVPPANRLGMLTDYVAPEERAVACPNQDVVYGVGAIALDVSAVVVQVPDFGDRFWVYQVVDTRHGQLRADRQDVRHDAGFLSARRSELERRRSQRDHTRVPFDDQQRPRRATHIPGRHARGQASDPVRAHRNHDVPDRGITTAR